jgi:riboflavin kinase/FMN adenylyltransferase
MSVEGLPLTVRGLVRHGDKRGRVLGFPTANLPGPTPRDMPFGVYASETRIVGRGDAVFRSVTSYGTRPTFDGSESRIETYILDFNEDIYGCEIDVRLVAFVRPELRFESVDALKAALKADVKAVRGMADSVTRWGKGDAE